jgi:hypothetical protein
MPPDSSLGLEPIEPDTVDRGLGPLLALARSHALGLEAEFYVLSHGQPGEKSEALEDHRDARIGAVERRAAIPNFARGGGNEAGDAAQQSALARTGPTQKGHDLSLMQRQGYVVKHGERTPVWRNKSLGHMIYFNDRRGARPR